MSNSLQFWRVWPLRRPFWWALTGAALLALVLVMTLSQRQWKARAAALEHENTDLQLKQLAHDLTAQSNRLIDRAREAAESDVVARMATEASDAGADRAELSELSREGVESLLILNSAHGVKFSGVVTDGRLREQPPDPALLQFLDAAGTGDRPLPMFGFAKDQWAAARPVLARNSSNAVLGWVVVARSLSPAVIAELAQSVHAQLVALPLRDFAPAVLPDSLRKAVATPAGNGFQVTTHLAADDAFAYAALRGSKGEPVWIFKLSRPPGPVSTFESRTEARYLKDVPTLLTTLMVLAGLLVMIVVALKRYFRHHRSVDARYRALIDQATDGIVIVDSKTHQVLYTNPAFLERLGYSSVEAQGLTLGEIFADGAATPENVLARLQSATGQMALNLQQRCKNGLFIDTEVKCNALDVDGRDVLAFVTHDVSLRRKAEQQLIENQQRLDKMAHHDQLTGLPNRHYLTAFLPQAIEEARVAGTMLGVVFLDLDRFKHINDTRGHETGDKLLQEVGTRLRACVRDTDVVIRMGGDEFVVVFRKVKSYDEVTLGAGRIVETLNRPIIIDQHPLQTTGSVGVSLYPRDGADMVELLKHSDTAMYQAKDRGRNNVQMFSHAMNRKLKQRVAVEASLREALRLKQLDVHYQPFVNLNTRKIVGLEALMRWRHPVHGMVPADQFIPVAEETGLIVPMGNFVLHRTMQNMSAWRKAGVPLVPVSLNVAPAQLQRGELQSTIATLLKTHGLRPEMIQLEMTERAVFDSHVPAGDNRQDTMARLRDLGIKIAIDDFGTGYSSLSYLKNWRVDALKIDRSFVRDLVTDSSDLAIVSAIIAIARHLHIQVIAEGIEGYQQAEILRRLGCAVGQGFLFARPMPADDMLKLLRQESEAPKEEEEEDMLAAFSTGRG